MSEDTDERMERAQRIRQMREGQREQAAVESDDDDDGRSEASSTDESSSEPTGDGSDAQSGAAADAETDTDEDGTVDASEDADAGDEAQRRDESAAGTDGAAATEDAAGEADPEPSSDSDGDAPASGAAASDAEPDSSSADGASSSADLDEEAAAAAERAAQAAAAVSGDVTGGDAVSAQATAGASPGAESGDSSGTTATAAPMQGPTGVELPDEDSIQAAIADEVVDADAGETTEPATGRGVAAEDAATNEETVRVLEFTLGEEHYCLDIAHVEEIVKREAITRVPNTPDYVEGVVDLRGQITTILDPKLLLDIDQEGSESLLVVFAPEEFEDQGAIGWVVDEVRQVAPIAKSEVSAAPVDADYIEGVIDRDDEEEFVIWTNPEVAIRMATGEAESED